MTNPKMKVTTASWTAGRVVGWAVQTCVVGSGRRFEGDFVTEGLEFADVVSGAAVAVDV